MALPSAGSFATFLANSLRDGSVVGWNLRPDDVALMQGWTDDDRRAVTDAARKNKSLQSLRVNFNQLSDETAEAFSGISQQLNRLKSLEVNVQSATAPSAVDEVLYGVMKSQSPISVFQLSGCSSPDAFLDFCERFPDLEYLSIAGQQGCTANSATVEGFTKAVATALGQLKSLHTIGLDCDGLHLSALRLLLALDTSTAVKALILTVSEASKGLLIDASRFFRSSTAVETVVVDGRQSVDATPFLDNGAKLPFSPSLKVAHFLRCDVRGLSGRLLDNAACVLQNVEVLAFGMCHFPTGVPFELLKKLPRLQSFACLTRFRKTHLHDTLDDEFNDDMSMMETNQELEDLCDAIEKQHSSLSVIHLDLVSRDFRMLPASERLLRNCKGSLVVNFARLPQQNCGAIVSGAAGVRADLHSLCLRFHRCQFDDKCYAAILRATGSIKTLVRFELGFDTHANLGVPEASIAQIVRLVKHNRSLLDLSLRGLGSDAAASLLKQIVPVLKTKNRSLGVLGLKVDLTAHPEILEPLYDMLKTNHVLQLLNQCTLPRDNPLTTQIRHLLRQNQYGRVFLHGNFYLSGVPAPMGLWGDFLTRVSKSRNGHKVMYAFLRAKPDLVQTSISTAEATSFQKGRPKRPIDAVAADILPNEILYMHDAPPIVIRVPRASKEEGADSSVVSDLTFCDHGGDKEKGDADRDDCRQGNPQRVAPSNTAPSLLKVDRAPAIPKRRPPRTRAPSHGHRASKRRRVEA